MSGIGSELGIGLNAVGSEEQGKSAPLPADSTVFPEWGIGNQGSKVVEASNAAEKAAYEKQGYGLWFDSAASAQNFWSDFWNQANAHEKLTSPIGNPLSWEQAIADFFNRLSQANTWIRVGKVVLGGGLLLIGLAHITGAENAVAKAVRDMPVPIPV